ncbi:MAG TPA: molybdenum cofactor guanylyltransferase [Cyclobacteriaceae bacterium]|nr:molybdenum cofactor guanylyltransferase [Cyclobacteriaceae bacterium]
MLGLVVCGGKSTRMGDDKGMLLSGNKTWAQIAKEKIEAINLRLAVSINPAQIEKYQSVFKKDELIVDATELDMASPLRGILSAHLHFPDEDILVLACDMPNMQTLVLEGLLKYYQKNSFEAVAFMNGIQIEPMCAVYSSRGLTKILSIYRGNNLTRHSLMNVLEILNAQYIKVDESWQPYFRNFNSPEDLKTLD